MDGITYYVIEINLQGDIPAGIHSMLHYQIEKGETRISPHVKLCGFNKEACIESIKLAEAYKNACIPIFNKRYGSCSEIDLLIHEVSTRGNRYIIKKIEEDSKIIRARLYHGSQQTTSIRIGY